MPSLIHIAVGTNNKKDWALPDRSSFIRGRVDPGENDDNVIVYSSYGHEKRKYPKESGYADGLNEAQKKFIGDLIKTVWEKPYPGDVGGKWVIRKIEWLYGDEDRVWAKTDKKTGDLIGASDPNFKNSFWNIQTNSWGPFENATKFSDKARKSILARADYVIKTDEDWEFVSIGDK